MHKERVGSGGAGEAKELRRTRRLVNEAIEAKARVVPDLQVWSSSSQTA